MTIYIGISLLIFVVFFITHLWLVWDMVPKFTSLQRSLWPWAGWMAFNVAVSAIGAIGWPLIVASAIIVSLIVGALGLITYIERKVKGYDSY